MKRDVTFWAWFRNKTQFWVIGELRKKFGAAILRDEIPYVPDCFRTGDPAYVEEEGVERRVPLHRGLVFKSAL